MLPECKTHPKAQWEEEERAGDADSANADRHPRGALRSAEQMAVAHFPAAE